MENKQKFVIPKECEVNRNPTRCVFCENKLVCLNCLANCNNCTFKGYCQHVD